MQMPTAIFDFDKTLTTKDSILPFAVHLTRKTRKLSGLAFFATSLLLFKARLVSNRGLKQRFLSSFLAGIPPETVRGLIRGFESDVLAGIINRPVYRVFQDYLERGCRVVVISSNFDLVLGQLSLLEGAEIIGTEVAFDSQTGSYSLAGPVCSGQEKLGKLRKAFGEEVFAQAGFWGDAEDGLLLERFAESHLVA